MYKMHCRSIFFFFKKPKCHSHRRSSINSIRDVVGFNTEKNDGEGLVLANANPSAGPVSTADIRSIPYSSLEKKAILSSNHYQMDAANYSPAVTDGNLQIQQTPFSNKKEEYLDSTKSTPDIEKKYVHSVYDAIAPHFSSTRFAKWPKVAKFLESLTPGSIVLDAGCGNGKYLGFNPNCFFIGCDISSPLISICANRGHEVLVADALNLPYRTGFGDAAISIAVLHHLSTEERRKRAIEELVRIVCKGGRILITVWAVEQEDRALLTKWTPLTDKYMEEWVEPTSNFGSRSSTASLASIQETEHYNSSDLETENNNSEEHEQAYSPSEQHLRFQLPDTERSTVESEREQEYFVPWHLPYHRAEISGASASAISSGFAKRDDKKGAVIYNRYYHVFAEGELERLASCISNAIIVDSFYDKSNWCVIIEKK